MHEKRGMFERREREEIVNVLSKWMSFVSRMNSIQNVPKRTMIRKYSGARDCGNYWWLAECQVVDSCSLWLFLSFFVPFLLPILFPAQCVHECTIYCDPYIYTTEFNITHGFTAILVELRRRRGEGKMWSREEGRRHTFWRSDRWQKSMCWGEGVGSHDVQPPTSVCTALYPSSRRAGWRLPTSKPTMCTAAPAAATPVEKVRGK